MSLLIWAEYTKELYDDDRKEIDVMKNNFPRPPIMKYEVRAAIKMMKHVKALGPDDVAMEEVEALGEFGIEKVTDVLNEIYDTGDIPTEMSKSIFIALPKKPGPTESELHRTISLMRHVTKVLLRVILMRVRNKIRPEIAKEQFGFCGRQRHSKRNTCAQDPYRKSPRGAKRCVLVLYRLQQISSYVRNIKNLLLENLYVE